MKKEFMLRTILPAFTVLIFSYVTAELIAYAIYGLKGKNYCLYTALGVFFGVLTALISSRWVCGASFKRYAVVSLLLYIVILIIGEFLFQITIWVRTSAVLNVLFYYFPQVVAFLYMCSFPVFHLGTLYLVTKRKDRAGA